MVIKGGGSNDPPPKKEKKKHLNMKKIILNAKVVDTKQSCIIEQVPKHKTPEKKKVQKCGIIFKKISVHICIYLYIYLWMGLIVEISHKARWMIIMVIWPRLLWKS